MAAAALLTSAWMMAHTEGPARDALQHLAFLAALCLATLLVRPICSLRPWQLAAWSGLGLAVSLSTDVTMYAMLFWVAVVVMVLGWSWGREALSSAGVRQALLLALVVAGVLNAIVGLLQWIGIADVFWPHVFVPEARGVALGAFRQRNLFATQMVLTVISTVWLHAWGRFSTPLTVLMLTVCAAALGASTSRIGLLEITMLAVIVLGFQWREAIPRRSALLMLYGATVAWVSIHVLARIAQQLNFSYQATTARLIDTGGPTEGRLFLWRDAWAMIMERPWLGWGWMEHGYGYYMAAPFGSGFEYPTNAHNLYLQIAVELGLPAALLLLVLTGLWAWQWRASVRNAPSKADGHSHVFGGLIVLALGMHSMVEFPLWNYSLLFVGSAALALTLRPVPKNDTAICWPHLSSGLALLLALGVTAAWMDYQKVLAIHRAPWGNAEKKREAMEHAQSAWLFKVYVDYEALHMTPITQANASAMKTRLEQMLHFTQGPAIIERLILVNVLLGSEQEARAHAERYRRFYTEAYEKWACSKPELATKYGPMPRNICAP